MWHTYRDLYFHAVILWLPLKLTYSSMAHLFWVKESIFDVIFVIWPLKTKIGAKMTHFFVKIGSKSTFLEIILSITQSLHSKSS